MTIQSCTKASHTWIRAPRVISRTQIYWKSLSTKWKESGKYSLPTKKAKWWIPTKFLRLTSKKGLCWLRRNITLNQKTGVQKIVRPYHDKLPPQPFRIFLSSRPKVVKQLGELTTKLLKTVAGACTPTLQVTKQEFKEKISKPLTMVRLVLLSRLIVQLLWSRLSKWPNL